jgi:non-ribosomal peptide synthetase component F
VGRLPLLGGAAVTATGTEAEVVADPAEACVHDVVRRHAAAMPDAVAVDGDGRRLTFAELDHGAELLAGALHRLGVGPGAAVGVCVSRSPDLVVAILGVLKSGGACVPLDPSDPPDLWKQVFSRAGVETVVTDNTLESSLPARPANVVRVDQPRAEASAVAHQVSPSAPAWVLPTSDGGDTPRLVGVSHASLVHMGIAASTVLGVGSEDVVLSLSPLTRESAVCEILAPLLSGARLALGDDDATRDGARLADELSGSGASLLIAPRSTIAVLGADEQPARPSLSVICTGAPLQPQRAARVLPRIGRLGNAWGSAEAGLWVAAGWVAGADSSAVVGRPAPGVRVLVVDETGAPLPAGVPGEAAVLRPGVGREPSGGPVRTGERVRLRADGAIDWLGRQDGRLVVQGVRFDPMELEAALKEHPSVADAVVAVVEDGDGREKLIAYVVGADKADPVAAELRRTIRRRVPDVLVPSSFVTLPGLPRGADGLVDRDALPTLASARRASHARVEPRTPTEQMLAGIWSELLGVTPDVHDNFFDLGGHSLLATMVVHRIQQLTGQRISLRALMFESLAQVAHALETPTVRTGSR